MPEADSTGQFEFRDYLAILLRRGWIILLTTVIVVATSAYLTSQKSEVYQATTTLRIDGGAEDIATELEVVRSQTLRDLAVGIDPDVGDISVRQVGPLSSSVIALTSQDRVPKRAAATADAFAQAYIAYRQNDRFTRTTERLNELTARRDAVAAELLKVNEQIAPILQAIDQLGLEPNSRLPGEFNDVALLARKTDWQQKKRELDRALAPLLPRQSNFQGQVLLFDNQIRDLTVTVSSDNAVVLTHATVPGDPISPKPVRDAITALALGLLLGLTFAFLVEYLDDSVKSREHVERTIGPDIPIIGQIPAFNLKRPSALVTFVAPTSAAAEAFRSLRTSVQFIGVQRDIRTTAVTSASPGEGKSTVIANLAVVLAGAGKRVVLVDCDLRRPTLHRFFGRAGLDSSVGVTSVIIGEAPLEVALQDVTGIQRLRLLPSGPIPPNPSELLSSKAFIELLEALTDDETVVLIDAPPVLPVTDAVLIGSIVDQIIFVVSASSSSRSKVRQALDRLARVAARPGGVVINHSEEEVVESYSYVEKPTKRRLRKKDDDADSSLTRFDPSRRSV